MIDKETAEREAMAMAVIERLGPHALTGGKMSPLDAFEEGWKAARALSASEAKAQDHFRDATEMIAKPADPLQFLVDQAQELDMGYGKPAEQEKVHLMACVQETGREAYVRSGPRAELEAERDKENAKGGDYFIRPAEQKAPAITEQAPPLPEFPTGYYEQGSHGWFLAYSRNPKANSKALYTADQLRKRDAMWMAKISAIRSEKAPTFNSIGIADNWSVTVEARSERVLCISDQRYAGASDIEPYKETIANCARHLLAFIGEQAPAGEVPSEDAAFWQWITKEAEEGREHYVFSAKAGFKAGRALSTHPTVPSYLPVLRDLLRFAERHVCEHEETHRGGVIWEICDQCGAKWADDEGGKPAFKWPEEIEAARRLLSAAPAAPQGEQP